MSMRKIYALLVVALLIGFPVAANEPLAVITAVTNPLAEVSLDTLKLIYQRKNLIDAEGTRWIPLNFPASDPLRRIFSRSLFGMLPEEQDGYWNIQYFNGISPPKVLVSEEAVLRFVTSTTGAIGYVRKHKVDQRVRVLLLLTPPAAKLSRVQ